MKKFLFVLMLMISGSAFAQDRPNIFQQMERCTFFAAKETEYSVYAHALKDDQMEMFVTLVKKDVDQVESDGAKMTLVSLAKMAWEHRKDAPTDMGMAVYEDCFKKSGITT